ncbi:MAG: hypothetical protein KCHDKBKB_03112 [Elusimicrobia bacterium]|nr:hypothetical protein [Elusimicrobiota bacterium]
MTAHANNLPNDLMYFAAQLRRVRDEFQRASARWRSHARIAEAWGVYAMQRLHSGGKPPAAAARVIERYYGDGSADRWRVALAGAGQVDAIITSLEAAARGHGMTAPAPAPELFTVTVIIPKDLNAAPPGEAPPGGAIIEPDKRALGLLLPWGARIITGAGLVSMGHAIASITQAFDSDVAATAIEVRKLMESCKEGGGDRDECLAYSRIAAGVMEKQAIPRPGAFDGAMKIAAFAAGGTLVYYFLKQLRR